jgi:hypothetical protein
MLNLLNSAKREILELRRRNELLAAQMSVVEVFAAATGLRRNDSCGMTIDVAWELERAIEELQKAKEEEPENV